MRAGSSPRVRGTLNCARVDLTARPVHPRVCGEHSSPISHPTLQSPVHPRVCGELRRTGKPMAPVIAGSSPRVRGTPAATWRSALCRRFIPACTGNSLCRLIVALGDVGSSPRVAGNSPGPWSVDDRRSSVHPRVYGELTTADTSRDQPYAVHPRVYGELMRPRRDRRTFTGSSPRVRGTLATWSATVSQDRFIPACTGNSASSLRRIRAMRRFIPACTGNSHPHLRATRPCTGSSPRVRGTRPGDYCRQSAGDRFIPACTGNSPSVVDVVLGSLPVHPRVYGELAIQSATWHHCDPVHPRVYGELPTGPHHRYDESSVHPRVYGELRRRMDRRRNRARRFIPACTGNSWSRIGLTAAPAGSSPRVRGTPRQHLIAPRRRLGSSPRVRGTQPRPGQRRHRNSGSSPRTRGTLLCLSSADGASVPAGRRRPGARAARPGSHTYRIHMNHEAVHRDAFII